MQRDRWAPLLISIPAGLWSVAMGVLGLWLIFEPHTGRLGNGTLATSAGIAALCAAQLVFIECVCLRLFPRVHARIHLISRSGNAVILGGALCVLLLATLVVGV